MASTGLLSRGVRLTSNAVSFICKIFLVTTQSHCFPPCAGSDSTGLMHAEDQGLNGRRI